MISGNDLHKSKGVCEVHGKFDNTKSLLCPTCDNHQKAEAEGSAEFALLSAEELNRVRQWFDFVQDTGTDFLVEDDFELAKKIYEKLSMRVPKSILESS